MEDEARGPSWVVFVGNWSSAMAEDDGGFLAVWVVACCPHNINHLLQTVNPKLLQRLVTVAVAWLGPRANFPELLLDAIGKITDTSALEVFFWFGEVVAAHQFAEIGANLVTLVATAQELESRGGTVAVRVGGFCH